MAGKGPVLHIDDQIVLGRVLQDAQFAGEVGIELRALAPAGGRHALGAGQHIGIAVKGLRLHLRQGMFEGHGHAKPAGGGAMDFGVLRCDMAAPLGAAVVQPGGNRIGGCLLRRFARGEGRRRRIDQQQGQDLHAFLANQLRHCQGHVAAHAESADEIRSRWLHGAERRQVILRHGGDGEIGPLRAVDATRLDRANRLVAAQHLEELRADMGLAQLAMDQELISSTSVSKTPHQQRIGRRRGRRRRIGLAQGRRKPRHGRILENLLQGDVTARQLREAHLQLNRGQRIAAQKIEIVQAPYHRAIEDR